MSDPKDDWRGDFAAAEANLLRAGRDATAEQLLDWLEEAVRFAYETGALPRREPDDKR